MRLRDQFFPAAVGRQDLEPYDPLALAVRRIADCILFFLCLCELEFFPFMLCGAFFLLRQLPAVRG